MPPFFRGKTHYFYVAMLVYQRIGTILDTGRVDVSLEKSATGGGLDHVRSKTRATYPQRSQKITEKTWASIEMIYIYIYRYYIYTHTYIDIYIYILIYT